MRIKISDIEQKNTPEINPLEIKWPYLQDANAKETVKEMLRAVNLPETKSGITTLINRFQMMGVDFWETVGRITYGLPMDNQPQWEYCPEYILTHKGHRPSPPCGGCDKPTCKTSAR